MGIDVGGTNTDVVLVSAQGTVLGAAKHRTTSDILSGMNCALRDLMAETRIMPGDVKGIFIGTTHSLNALQNGSGLAKTGLVRIGPCPSKIKAAMSWPAYLSSYLQHVAFIPGGYRYDGSRNHHEGQDGCIDSLVEHLRAEAIEALAIVGTFSPMFSEEEQRIKQRILEQLPGLSVTMSHEISSIGFIERENTTLLNAMLSKVIQRAMTGLSALFRSLRFTCPYWIVQNDGSLMTVEEAIHSPILTIGSGATNSFRGGSQLASVGNGIVVDMGGSTTEIGRVIDGQPEETVAHVKVNGVKINVRMPYSVSLGIGGGTVLASGSKKPVFSKKVAADLEHEAIAWGGSRFTLTDAFLKRYPESLHHENIDVGRLSGIPASLCEDIVFRYTSKVRNHIEKMQDSQGSLPVILVGGGSPLLANTLFFKYGKSLHPFGYKISNAVGACNASVNAEEDQVFWLDQREKEEIIHQVKRRIVNRAVEKGARKDSVQVVSIEEYPFTYLKGEIIRIRGKAAGELELS